MDKLVCRLPCSRLWWLLMDGGHMRRVGNGMW